MWSRVAGSVVLAACLAASSAGAARSKVEPTRSRRYWVEAKHRKVRAQRSEIALVARAAMPAVVSITTRQEPGSEPSDGSSGEQKGLGAGFIIHPDGYILTSAHVIEGAVEITVSLLSPTGFTRDYVARVVGEDSQSDCALLKIDAGHKLPVLKLGSSKDVEVADWVVAIGNPFGLGHSVTVGVISFKGRTDVTPSGRSGYFNYLQTDASINPGSSGGPILDINGEVVAIANAVNVAGQGIGFAVPIDMAKEVLPQLYAHGSVRRGWMGVTVQDITPELAKKNGVRSYRGVMVSELIEGGPAARSGLRVGDVIMGVNRAQVDRAHALRWRVATAGAGHEVHLKVARRGRPMKVRVMLEDLPVIEQPPEEVVAAAPGRPAGKRARKEAPRPTHPPPPDLNLLP
jgi:serine protease Do